MAHLRLIDVDAATGRLKEEYDAAIGRAGKMWMRPVIGSKSWMLNVRGYT